MTRASERGSLVSESVDTPVGVVVLVESSGGMLCLAEFADRPGRIERGLRRLGLWPAEVMAGKVAAATKAAFAAYFDGDIAALDRVPVELRGTPFQNDVWSALRRISPGEMLAYGAFAQRIGRPSASRAVGHANGANPLSIVVPCHRLVAADGALTNYGGGIERKRWLLDHEARYAGRLDDGVAWTLASFSRR